MIRIEKGYLNAPCNSCGADTDITLLIYYKQNSGGLAINLCDNCRKELIKKLKECKQNDNRSEYTCGNCKNNKMNGGKCKGCFFNYCSCYNSTEFNSIEDKVFRKMDRE